PSLMHPVALFSPGASCLVSSCKPRDDPLLHSFPTRRSSDLVNDCIASRTAACSSAERSRSVAKSQRRASSGNVSSGMAGVFGERSEEHTSALQSRGKLLCRRLLEKKRLQTSRATDQETTARV